MLVQGQGQDLVGGYGQKLGCEAGLLQVLDQVDGAGSAMGVQVAGMAAGVGWVAGVSGVIGG